MMTEEETKKFGEDLASKLRGDEDVESITQAMLERVAEVPPEHFQAWAQTVVDGAPPPGTGSGPYQQYRQRLQVFNANAAKDARFMEVIMRYHAWKAPASAAERAKDLSPETAVARVMDAIRSKAFTKASQAMYEANAWFRLSATPEACADFCARVQAMALPDATDEQKGWIGRLRGAGLDGLV